MLIWEDKNIINITKQTSKKPRIGPNKAPDKILKNTGPGIAKDYKKI